MLQYSLSRKEAAPLYTCICLAVLPQIIDVDILQQGADRASIYYIFTFYLPLSFQTNLYLVVSSQNSLQDQTGHFIFIFYTCSVNMQVVA